MSGDESHSKITWRQRGPVEQLSGQRSLNGATKEGLRTRLHWKQTVNGGRGKLEISVQLSVDFKSEYWLARRYVHKHEQSG